MVGETKLPTLREIDHAVRGHYGLLRRDLIRRDIHQRAARPRQIAMALGYWATEESLQAVGRYFGKRHHATVLGAMSKVEARFSSDFVFRCDVLAILFSLGNPFLRGAGSKLTV